MKSIGPRTVSLSIGLLLLLGVAVTGVKALLDRGGAQNDAPTSSIGAGTPDTTGDLEELSGMDRPVTLQGRGARASTAEDAADARHAGIDMVKDEFEVEEDEGDIDEEDLDVEEAEDEEGSGPTLRRFRRVRPTASLGAPSRWNNDSYVYTLRFSPDARLVYSGGPSGTIHVRDTATGRTEARLRPEKVEVVSDLAISRDGRRLLAGDKGGVYVWDLSTGKTVRRFDTNSGAIWEVAYGEDDRIAVTAGDIGEALVWDPTDGSILHRVPQTETINGACLVQGGRGLVTSDAEGTLTLWDVGSARAIWSKKSHQGAGGDVHRIPGTKQVITCGEDGRISIWRIADGHPVRSWDAHDERITELGLSPDGTCVASGGWEGRVRHWRIADGTCLWSRNAHRALIVAMAYSQDGRIVASGARDATVRLWDAATGKPHRGDPEHAEGHVGAVRDLLWTPDGLVSTGLDGTIRVWDPTTLTLTHCDVATHDQYESLRLRPTDGTVAVAGEAGLAVFDPRSGGLLWRNEEKLPATPTVALFDGTGEYLLWTGPSDSPAYRRSLVDDEPIQPLAGPYRAIAADATGSRTAMLTDGDTLEIWSADGTRRSALKLNEKVGGSLLLWHPDGHSVLIAGALHPRPTRVAVDDGRILTTYASLAHAVLDATYDATGRRLVVVTDEGGIRCHDALTGNLTHTLRSGLDAERGPLCVAISPNGRTVFTGNHDGSIQIFELPD